MSRRPNRRPLPSTPVEAQITSYTHDGRGVAHVDGKAIFIIGALPGEHVFFLYTAMHRDYAEGKVVEVVQASPLRVEPRCPHFGVCGGCSLQHLAEDAQIEEKQRLLMEQFRRLGKVEPEGVFPPLTGPLWGYRRKARLGVKWVAKKNKVLVGFREKASGFLAEIETCAVLHPAIGEHLRDLGELIAGLSLRERIPQIEVAVGDEATALVFRVMNEPTAADLEALRSFGLRYGFDIYLQPKGPDSIFALQPERPALLSYALPEQGVEFRFQPTDFTQVNTEINRKMVDRVLEILEPQADEDVLDLFCGLGNFTLPLARRAAHVVGVEGSQAAVERGRQNAEYNGIANVEFHVADLFQPQEHSPWATRTYHKVLLDPARTGAAEILAYAPRWKASRIVYVSCNPSTLARDAGILVHQHGYRLVRAGVMDMFPHTSHVESIALFEK
ncbi:23S rRNA (uracil(1939)-C(5))-methyltransferase RlmD [Methylococcus sp. EFPC2]|uniref:23S rRNA (uracil(1939)-C(5))-methyltransferase RlmD n=1 Tax=Methylococcus sp. EFPC2 TaxID=2812648 RepID=UPI001967C363|nr:23S rRNA (uracil(1939)-C(5))-methyltransferase RlmD [Methylococcus sp. EFPC2]QSA96774.1 23S rRNA (uracil(1939)-C(5))-methyltransferase RlmD [Methylococcus sp. EFPC2]